MRRRCAAWRVHHACRWLVGQCDTGVAFGFLWLAAGASCTDVQKVQRYKSIECENISWINDLSSHFDPVPTILRPRSHESSFPFPRFYVPVPTNFHPCSPD